MIKGKIKKSGSHKKTKKFIDKEIKDIALKFRERLNKFDEFSIKRANIVVDFMEDIVKQSVIEGYAGMNNSLLLRYLKDARELANKK